MLINVAGDSNGKGAENIPKYSRGIQNDKFKILLQNIVHLSSLKKQYTTF